MTITDVLTFLAFWSLIGAALFSMFVVFVFRSGIVYIARRADGTLKEKIPLAGFLIMAGFLSSIVVFFVAANFFGLARKQITVGFGTLMALNYALYLILFLFDTLVIDGFVLAYWRPDFLLLPSELGKEWMKKHIIKSAPVGTALGLVFAGLTTIISYFCFMT